MNIFHNQGTNIIIRQALPEDAHFLFKAYHDPDFLRLYSSNQSCPDTIEQLHTQLMQRLFIPPASLSNLEFIVIHVKHGKIGVMALCDISTTHRRAEMLTGIFSKNQRNFGHGVEAAFLMMDLAFNQLGLNKIYGLVYKHNEISKKVMLQAGFSLEGELKQHHYSVVDKGFETLYHIGLTVDDFRQSKVLQRLSQKKLRRDMTQSPKEAPSLKKLLPPAISPYQISASPHFAAWLLEQQASLVFSTNRSSKLFFIGTQSNEQLSVFERSYSNCGAMAVSGKTLYVANIFQLWRLDNRLESNQNYQGYDTLYIPQSAYTIGDLQIQDIGIDKQNRPILVSALFNGLVYPSEQYSFEPYWKPPFISEWVAEDRCHLSGLAVRKNCPRYVTAFATLNENQGWRKQRHGSGIVLDITHNKIICSGLSAPLSPRWYQNHLWLLNAGNKQFGYVDERKIFKPIAQFAGIPRGLDFVKDFAITGLSGMTEPLEEGTNSYHPTRHCEIQIIDITTGRCVHWLKITGAIEQIFDIRVITEHTLPMALGFKTDEIQRIFSLPKINV